MEQVLVSEEVPAEKSEHIANGVHVIRKNNVNTLVFFVTNRCNFRCNHCFYWQSLNINDTLSLENIKKIADTVGDLDTLLVAGGEPFLRPDLIEVCKYFIDKCNLRLLSIPTNGSMDQKIIDFVKEMHNKCKLRLYISLEGSREMHNKIRQIDNFDKAIGLLKTLVEMKKEYDFTPMANITISNQNLKDIDELARQLNEIGVHYSVVPLRGAPKDGELRPPTSQEWGDLIASLSKNRNFMGLEGSFRDNKTSLLRKMHRKMLTKSKTKMYQKALDGQRKFICNAGDDIGVIDYDGNVMFCEMTKKVANLKDFDWDFNKLWFSKEAEDYRPEVKTCVCTHGCFIRSKYMKTTEWISRMVYAGV
jgi:MoaA/NifB/PqqE/SkfB family radical SAM enzyme